MSTIPEQTFTVIERAQERMKLLRDKLPAQFEGQVPGVRAVPAQLFPAWFVMHAQQWPPVPVPSLGGQMVNAWVLGLTQADGGDAILRRFEDLTGVDMNWVRQAGGKPPRQRRMVA